jgi:predicted metalloprotease
MVRRHLIIATAIVCVVGSVCVGVADAAAASPPMATSRQSRQRSGQGQDVVTAAVADIQDYWHATLPAVYGIDYKSIPPGHVRGYDKHSPRSTFSECARSSDQPYDVNASYCPLDDTVTYDTGTLFPGLTKLFGRYAPALVLAHEWGHAIQSRTLTPNQLDSTSSVLTETQADCFAGAWVGWVEDGHSKRFKFGQGLLEKALAGLMFVRDPVGGDPSNDQAHGNGFDRTNAFQLGVESGAARCKAWDTDPPTITEIPFANAEQAAGGGEMPFEQVLPAVKADLDAYGAQILPGYQPIGDIKIYNGQRRSSVPTCAGDTFSRDDYEDNSLSCTDDNYIAYDKEYAHELYDDIGDFALAWDYSWQWGEILQDRVNAKGNNLAFSLRSACLSGAWAGSLARGEHPTQLHLAPGDLDKIVEAFLDYSDTANTPTSKQTVGTAFKGLEAFRDGFFASGNPIGECVNTASFLR